jgi:1-deoxy-D-xylulose-5-phosphate reductoisomerase
MTKTKVAILGAAGSIGQNTLDVIRKNENFFEVVLLQTHSNKKVLDELLVEFPNALNILSGGRRDDDLLKELSLCGADVVVNGIAGFAGLAPSIAALRCGAHLALANKETIVAAGPLVRSIAENCNKKIIPVDSEHSAVYNLRRAHGRDAVKEVYITASGGPFLRYTMEQLQNVTPAGALRHPTWKMGAKISIDSASLANKGLEVIEAARLFDLRPDGIKVVVHPESIIHAMIKTHSGAIYAQLSKPDMRLPIALALFEARMEGEASSSQMNTGNIIEELDFTELHLNFEKPDLVRFPMLKLARDTLKQGSLYPAVYNAANEIAVERFVKGEIGFCDIPRIVENVLQKDWPGNVMNLGEILEADTKARKLSLQIN